MKLFTGANFSAFLVFAENIGKNHVLGAFPWFPKGFQFPGCFSVVVKLVHKCPPQVYVRRQGSRRVSQWYYSELGSLGSVVALLNSALHMFQYMQDYLSLQFVILNILMVKLKK